MTVPCLIDSQAPLHEPERSACRSSEYILPIRVLSIGTCLPCQPGAESRAVPPSCDTTRRKSSPSRRRKWVRGQREKTLQCGGILHHCGAERKRAGGVHATGGVGHGEGYGLGVPDRALVLRGRAAQLPQLINLKSKVAFSDFLASGC